MVAYVAYVAIASLAVILVGGVLLKIDNLLERKNIDYVTACAEYLMIKAGKEVKQLSIETIKEINENLFEQISEKEEAE